MLCDEIFGIIEEYEHEIKRLKERNETLTIRINLDIITWHQMLVLQLTWNACLLYWFSLLRITCARECLVLIIVLTWCANKRAFYILTILTPHIRCLQLEFHTSVHTVKDIWNCWVCILSYLSMHYCLQFAQYFEI